MFKPILFSDSPRKSASDALIFVLNGPNFAQERNFARILYASQNLFCCGYLAYFCKAGDGVVDVQLIADLHKSEVFKCAEYLGVPMRIVNAKPSADLWEDQEDEKELGFTYDFIEFYTGSYLKLSEDEKKSFLDNLNNYSHKEFLDFEVQNNVTENLIRTGLQN